MPVVGTIIMYLWVILLADEFMDLLASHSLMALIIKKVKIFSFIIIAFYGMTAFALWVNRISLEPAMTKKAKIISITDVDMGAINYRRLTISPWDDNTSPQNILLTYEENIGLYRGEDIEILIRKGILSLYRVLEINRDMEKFFLKMVKAAPNSKVGMEGLVEIYSTRGEFEKALKWYTRLEEASPAECGIGLDLGYRLLEARRYKQAVNVAKKILMIRRDYEALYMLGYALAWAGEKHEAEKYLIEAAELDPTDSRAFYYLGYIYRDTGRYGKAKEAWRNVLKLIPNFPEVENNIKALEKYR
jgi:tetratricopeptide (TPR) repeat protein